MDSENKTISNELMGIKTKGLRERIAIVSHLAMHGWHNSLSLPHDLSDELYAMKSDYQDESELEQARYEKILHYALTGEYTTRWGKSSLPICFGPIHLIPFEEIQDEMPEMGSNDGLIECIEADPHYGPESE